MSMLWTVQSFSMGNIAVIKQALNVLLIAVILPVYADDRGTEQLSFIEFHDPGWMLLRDESGNELRAEFYYELIQFNDIQAWKPNEELLLSLTDTHGIQLTRMATGQSYTIVFRDYDPIAESLENCLAQSSGSSMEIASCYSKPIRYWKGQAQSLYNNRIESAEPNLVTALQIEQQAWELYQETRNAAIEELMKESRGTIQIIRNAEDSYFQAKSRAESLLRYF